VDGSGLSASEQLGIVTGLQFTGLPTTSDFLLNAATLTLRLPTVGAAQVPLFLRVYARNTPAPAAYSSSNVPPLAAEMTALSDTFVVSVAVLETGDVTVTATLPPPRLNTARAFGAAAFTGLALHVHAITGDGTAVAIEEGTAVLEVTTDTRTHTGMEIPHGEHAASVPDACPICGEVTLRQTWTWCGLHKRMECASCADPEDRREPTTLRPFPFVGGRGSSRNA
jgi:predicted RNA-binding Zn-ribbon protein involved in translation (DUF1610 family)